MKLKYKLDAEMKKLNKPRYKLALKALPDILEVAPNTIHNYRKLQIGDITDISYESVTKIELFFGLKPGGLINYKIDCITLDELAEQEGF